MQPDPKDLPRLVRDLHRRGTAWVPCGLGSRLHWGAALRQPCIPLSCAGLTGIVALNPGDFTLTVRAGTPLRELQQALAAHRQWLAVDWPWGTSARGRDGGSIGGLVARGLAGGYRHRHLAIRDQLIGLSLIRADGVEARAGGRVVKNVAGYDLMRLFCGSWGSLGLITELNLRTLPLPAARAGLLLRASPAALAIAASRLLASALMLERLDWWSAALAQRAGLGCEPLLLIALGSVSPASLREQQAAIRRATTLPCQDIDADELEGLLAISRAGGDEAEGDRPSWLLRLAVPSDRASLLLEHPTLAGQSLELAAGSGIGQAWGGDGPGGFDGPAIRALRAHCLSQGGWLTVLQQPQGSDLPAWLDAPSRPLIEAVKRRFDPLLQLAPGRLPGVARGLAPASRPATAAS